MAAETLEQLIDEVAGAGRRQAEWVGDFSARARMNGGTTADQESFRVTALQGLSQTETALRIWREILDDLSGRPVRREVALRRVEKTVDALRISLSVAQSLAALARDYPDIAPLSPDVRQSIEAFPDKLASAKAEAEAWLAALQRPAAVLDPAKVSEALQTSRAGENRESSEVIAAIKAARS